MFRDSAVPPLVQEKNARNSQPAVEKVAKGRFPVPTVNWADLSNAVLSYKSSVDRGDDPQESLSESFPYRNWIALTERARVFWSLALRPEFAVYHLAYVVRHPRCGRA